MILLKSYERKIMIRDSVIAKDMRRWGMTIVHDVLVTQPKSAFYGIRVEIRNLIMVIIIYPKYIPSKV